MSSPIVPYMDNLLEVITTRDCSRTLYSGQYQRSFHSVHGALTEARHVFLEGSGTEELLKSQQEVRVLEIGFGAGLNWLITASAAHRHGTRLSYTALDKQIPSAELLSQLGYGELIGAPALANTIEEWRKSFRSDVPYGTYNLPHEHDGTLQLCIGEATEASFPDQSYDSIYFDAFDPGANPELWVPEIFSQLHRALRDGGCLATYSVAGHVRRALTSSGFSVVRRPGPPGKRHVLAAWKH
ncbi:MAG: tRNA (5-methylaminomethyl-2-thiouridine)(34)-methyltransferase MnmD [Rhodothermaceae bacterium]|nr:tRNA (5-methylaminomethyl-2-thiouridine)(34)-methyltransferase MnmD [Rhodothermaceae bacterium]